MSRYVIVAPLEPLHVADSFSVSQWPLHVTVAPNFQAAVDTDDLIQALHQVCLRLEQVDVLVGNEDLFGPDANIPVNVVEHDDGLSVIHETLINALVSLGAGLDTPEYSRQGYRPHITITPTSRARAGDRIRLRQLALVNMEPSEATELREVLWTSALAARQSVTIEPLTSLNDADAEAIRDLLPQLSANASFDRSRLETMIRHDATDLLVARLNGQIVGMATVVIFPLPTGLRGHIDDVVVDGDSRGRGIARELLITMIERATAQGVRTLDLTSRPSRTSAIKLYESLGFVHCDSYLMRYDPIATRRLEASSA